MALVFNLVLLGVSLEFVAVLGEVKNSKEELYSGIIKLRSFWKRHCLLVFSIENITDNFLLLRVTDDLIRKWEEPVQIHQTFFTLNRSHFKYYFSNCISYMVTPNKMPDSKRGTELDGTNDELVIFALSASKISKSINKFLSLKIGRKDVICICTASQQRYKNFQFTSKKFHQTSILIGKTLKVSYIQQSPGIFKDENGHTTGSLYNMLSLLAANSNVTLIYIERTRRHGFGNLNTDGSWDGLMGELVNGETDLVPNFIHSYIRNSLVDFSNLAFFGYVDFCALPKDPVLNWQALLNSLGWEIWVFLFVALLLLGLVVSLLVYNIVFKCYTLSINYWVISRLLRIMLDQPLIRVPKYRLNQVLIACWIVACFFVGLVYKGNLVGELTKRNPLPFPKSFRDIYLSDSKYHLIVYGSKVQSIVEVMFSESLLPYMKHLAMGWSTERKSLAACVEASIQNTNTACIYFRDSLYLEKSEKSRYDFRYAKLIVADTTELPFPFSFGMPKNSAYRLAVNWYVNVCKTSGLIIWWNKSYMQKVFFQNARMFNEKQCTLSGSKWCALSFLDSVSVFILHLLGLSVAIAACLWELYKTKQKQQLNVVFVFLK